jgi:hypothetical protein
MERESQTEEGLEGEILKDIGYGISYTGIAAMPT